MNQDVEGTLDTLERVLKLANPNDKKILTLKVEWENLSSTDIPDIFPKIEIVFDVFN